MRVENAPIFVNVVKSVMNAQYVVVVFHAKNVNHVKIVYYVRIVLDVQMGVKSVCSVQDVKHVQTRRDVIIAKVVRGVSTAQIVLLARIVSNPYRVKNVRSLQIVIIV